MHLEKAILSITALSKLNMYHISYRIMKHVLNDKYGAEFSHLPTELPVFVYNMP